MEDLEELLKKDMLTREEYFAAVKEAVKRGCHPLEEARWNDPDFQEVINNMYDDFSKYTQAQRDKLISSAGPIEPFWQRVVYDGVFVYHMM